MLKWLKVDLEHSTYIMYTSVPIKVDLDFADICEERYWGSTKFSFDIKFSIHKRMVENHKWKYQLLAPNGIHIYCVDIEEAKKVAEVIYRRITTAIYEQVQPKLKILEVLEKAEDKSAALNKILHNKFCRNTKGKTKKLLSFAKKRGIDGRVYYSRLPRCTGWMYVHSGCEPILLGSNYAQALDMINSGTLDFYREVAHEEGQVGTIQQVCEC